MPRKYKKLCEVFSMVQTGLTSFAHAVGQNAFHLVWKPKWCWDPFKFLRVREDCDRFLRTAARKNGMHVYELQVMPDHVHMFVEIPPTLCISKALQLLKGYSAYALLRTHPWLRRYFRTGHLWSPGKFFRSVGNVTAETIKHYIAESNRGRLHQRLLTRYPAL